MTPFEWPHFPLLPSVESGSDNPITKRAARFHFDSHLKEGIRINSNVALQNPTHVQ
jgi:hypothetical protein